MLPRSGWLRRPRLLLALLAAGCFLLALLRPGWTWQREVGSSLLVVDISQSMNVADGGAGADGQPQTRLAATQALLQRVLRELPCGHAVGVGVFVERRSFPLLAPLEVCLHRNAISNVLQGLDWRMAWAADTHLYYGVQSALDQIASEWPGTALALFTDGTQAPAVAPGREPRAQQHQPPVAGILFGVGGDQPLPVPKLDNEGRVSGYWTAEEAAAFSPTGGGRTLSVAEMDAMSRAGQDPRNAGAERRPGGQEAHLSRRDDAMLATLAQAYGLQSAQALDAGSVVRQLRALPGAHRAALRQELHTPLVLLGALALLASLLPWPQRPSLIPTLPWKTRP